MKSVCLLPSAYLAPVRYYTKLYAFDEAYIEAHEHYVKQTYRNRCLIAAPSGVQALVVPVMNPGAEKCPMRDIRISDHGNWRRQHWHALETAYRNSPFFEFYADDFLPFYTRKWNFLFDFEEAIRAKVCELVGLHTKVRRTVAYGLASREADIRAADYRDLADSGTDGDDAAFVASEYYQVFRERHGFLPNLSVADLLFNMGPETIFVLRDSIRKDALCP